MTDHSYPSVDYWLNGVRKGEFYSCRRGEGGEEELVVVVSSEWDSSRLGYEGVPCLEVETASRQAAQSEVFWVPRYLFTEFQWGDWEMH